MKKFTNISNGPRGIHTADGIVTVEPGATVEVVLASSKDATGKLVDDVPPEEWFASAGTAAAKAAADPLDHDGDGRKGGHVDNKKT